MINEKYIFSPNLSLDIPKLKEIVSRNISKPEPTLATHQRLVEKEPYLVELNNQYPFLSRIYNIYITPPNAVVPIHICPDRGCGLNVPIQYTDDSYTIFYQPKDKMETVYDAPRIYHLVQSEMIEVYRYTLDRPVIMNTRVPHSVIGGPKRYRVILSWSINNLYEDVKKLVGVL